MLNTKRQSRSVLITGILAHTLTVTLLFHPLILKAQQPDTTNIVSPLPADLQEISRNGVLRILYQRDQSGSAYKVSNREREMLKQFAGEQGLSLEWIAVDSCWNLIPQLVAGKGDIIVGRGPELAAGMVDQASFTSAWMAAYHLQVVVRTDTTRIRSLDDLGDRQVVLKESSPAWPLLRQLAEQHPAMELVAVPEHLSYGTIMARVASGQYDVTVADSDFLHYYLPDHPELSVAYDLGDSTVKAWVVHSKAVNLQKSLDQFLFRHQLEWSIAGNSGSSEEVAAADWNAGHGLDTSGQLSPYDDLVRKYADKYGFDWRLIVALMYQESQFNPAALSTAGAEGLMQVLPETASTIGAGNLSDPEANIRAGIKYLNFVRNHFESGLLLEERTWFSLASYNAGPGRVMRARKLATQMGLDANRWFGNVEKAMLALARPVEKDGEVVRNCRCGQTVVYVKKIRKLYHNYVRLTRAGQVAKSGSTAASPYDI